MRHFSHILLYSLLSASAAQAGPLSRGVKDWREAPGTLLDSHFVDEGLSPAVRARQEEDSGVAPSPIFSTIEPDDAETTSTPPAASSEGTGDGSQGPPQPSSHLPETDVTSSTIIYGDTPTPTSFPPVETQPPNAPPEGQQSSAESAVSSSEEVFLPPISSTISLPDELQPTESQEENLRPTSAIEQPDLAPTSPVVESETTELVLEPTETLPFPSDGEENDEGGVTPSPIFSTISEGPATTEDSLSLASSLSLPLDDNSSVESDSSTPLETPSVSSELPITETPESDVPSTTESFPGGTLFTTTVGIPSPTDELPPPPPESQASSPVEGSLAPSSSALPAESTPSTPVTSSPGITPTGEPDNQVPTNRGPADPSATASVPADIFEINLQHARAFHQRFKSLTAESACVEGQAACINGQIARCNSERGGFDLEACAEGTRCFPLPLVFEDGVSLNCADPAEARRILGVEDEDDDTQNPPPAQPSEDATVTETPKVTETIATETVNPPGETAVPEDEVVTVTTSPTVTETIATETVRNPGEGVASPRPTNEEPDDETTTTLMGTLTLTTVITVSPPAPAPITEPGTTHFVTVTVTAQPSVPPSEVVAEPSPTPTDESGGGDEGGDNNGDGGDNNEDDENRDDGDDDNEDDENRDDGGDRPRPIPTSQPLILTSLDIIFLPTTFVTTTRFDEAAVATDVAEAKETLTVTETETVSVPVTITVTQREVRIEQETVTVTLVAA